MTRHVLTILAAIAIMALAFAPSAGAAQQEPMPSTVFMMNAQQGSCTSTDPSKINLRENSLSDGGDGDDHLYICGSVSSLNAIEHTLPGGCQGAWTVSMSTWNDCVSSMYIWVPEGYAWLFFEHASYDGAYFRVCGGKSASAMNMPSGWNDRVSSILYVQQSC